MRTAILTLAAAALALPALAQSAPPADTAPRQRLVEILKGETCPKSADPNEIVVCRTIDPDNQFRIPPVIRQQQAIAREDNVREERAALVDAGRPGGTGTCSAQGIAGQTGCTQGLNVLGAGATVAKAVRGEDTVAEKAPQ